MAANAICSMTVLCRVECTCLRLVLSQLSPVSMLHCDAACPPVEAGEHRQLACRHHSRLVSPEWRVTHSSASSILQHHRISLRSVNLHPVAKSGERSYHSSIAICSMFMKATGSSKRHASFICSLPCIQALPAHLPLHS